jgi:hypothetical protein
MRRRPIGCFAVLLAVLAAPCAVPAQEQAGRVLNWETGEHRSYAIPALEVPAFIVGLNVFNRLFLDSDEYDTDRGSVCSTPSPAATSGRLPGRRRGPR